MVCHNIGDARPPYLAEVVLIQLAQPPRHVLVLPASLLTPHQKGLGSSELSGFHLDTNGLRGVDLNTNGLCLCGKMSFGLSLSDIKFARDGVKWVLENFFDKNNSPGEH